MSVEDYNSNPDENTAISGINIGEGCNASNINDAIRQLMADLATFSTGGVLLPSGALVPHAGSTVPAGFLLCDGSPVSRTTYDKLFTAIATLYGVGDGSTTFNLPNYGGKVVLGAGGSFTVGANGGEATHTLIEAEIPALSLSGSANVSGTTGAAGAHSHTVTDSGHAHTAPSGFSGAGFSGTVSGGGSAQTTVSTNSATTGISIDSASDHAHSFSAAGTLSGATSGGGGAHNNMQPYTVANMLIKT